MSPADVMRLHPHPVAALLRTQGWNDADYYQQYDEGDDDWSADGWSPTWRIIRARMETRGMLLTIREASVEEGTGFIAIWVEAEEAILPRPHLARGFNLHRSIGKLHNYFTQDIVYDALGRINARWAGRSLRLRINRMGGTAELHPNDPLAADEDLVWLHDRGCYWYCPLHISL